MKYESEGNYKQLLLFDNSVITNKSFCQASPVLKWAGGKTQLLPKLRERYPENLKNNNITTYIEPFFGGGAVFFDLVNNFKIEKAYLFDINPELIILYKVIQKDVDSLIEELSILSEQYLALDNQERKLFYYLCRDRYNCFDKKIDTSLYLKEWSKRSALTIFLNRTCFNGLYRVNKKGAFNVPIGRYKNPQILDLNNLKAVNQVFQIAHIQQNDFSELFKYIDNHTFIYYDPPYRPISKTASFNSYSSTEFNDSEQKRLRDIFKVASDRGVLQMLSNSDPSNYIEDSFFDELYQEFNIERISASRAINSKGSERGAIKEILITNY
ncbi:MAG: DNA adenine methylase [Xenococcaceae cyanobacterium]